MENLRLPDQEFSDSRLNEIVLRARLDEAETIAGWTLPQFVPLAVHGRIAKLKEQAEAAYRKNHPEVKA